MHITQTILKACGSRGCQVSVWKTQLERRSGVLKGSPYIVLGLYFYHLVQRIGYIHSLWWLTRFLDLTANISRTTIILIMTIQGFHYNLPLLLWLMLLILAVSKHQVDGHEKVQGFTTFLYPEGHGYSWEIHRTIPGHSACTQRSTGGATNAAPLAMWPTKASGGASSAALSATGMILPRLHLNPGLNPPACKHQWSPILHGEWIEKVTISINH